MNHGMSSKFILWFIVFSNSLSLNKDCCVASKNASWILFKNWCHICHKANCRCQGNLSWSTYTWVSSTLSSSLQWSKFLGSVPLCSCYLQLSNISGVLSTSLLPKLKLKTEQRGSGWELLKVHPPELKMQTAIYAFCHNHFVLWSFI